MRPQGGRCHGRTSAFQGRGNRLRLTPLRRPPTPKAIDGTFQAGLLTSGSARFPRPSQRANLRATFSTRKNEDARSSTSVVKPHSVNRYGSSAIAGRKTVPSHSGGVRAGFSPASLFATRLFGRSACLAAASALYTRTQRAPETYSRYFSAQPSEKQDGCKQPHPRGTSRSSKSVTDDSRSTLTGVETPAASSPAATGEARRT